jgi:hypothetical protein
LSRNRNLQNTAIEFVQNEWSKCELKTNFSHRKALVA